MYKIPNRKKKLLTKEFLKTFKDELDKVFHDGNEINLDKRNYINTYQHMEDTIGFEEALKTTCEEYNLVKAIYEYGNNLLYDSDFDNEIMNVMIKKGVIKEGSLSDLYDYTEDKIRWTREGDIQWYKSTIQHKGYNIVKYNYWWANDTNRTFYKPIILIDGLPPHLTNKN
jgi:hypothetical protein